MKNIHIVLGFVLLTLISCSRESVGSVVDKDKESVYVASFSIAKPDSKTVVDSGTGAMSWKPGNAISLFYGNQNLKFTSKETEISKTATFAGKIPEDIKNPADERILALYPYNASAVCDGHTIVTTLSHIQQSEENTFSDDLFISVSQANVSSENLYFHNLCSGVRFRFQKEGVYKVIFRGNDSEAIAGEVRIAIDDNGAPIIDEILNPQQEIVLECKGGFKPDVWYYIVTLPVSFSQGYSFTLVSSALKTQTISSPGIASFNRSRISSVNLVVDKDLNAAEWEYMIPRSYRYERSYMDLNIEVNRTKPESGYYDLNSDGTFWILDNDPYTLTLQSSASRIKGHDTFLCVNEFNGIEEKIGLFSGFSLLRSISGLEHLDMSDVTNMSCMFYECQSLGSVDISHFNTENVVDMSNMFYCCGISTIDLSSFDLGNVVSMAGMFEACRSLRSVNLSGLVAPKLTDVSSMFSGSGLKEINLKGFEASNITNMGSMFSHCESLVYLDLNDLQTPNVTSLGGMFYYCTQLTSVRMDNFYTGNVTDIGYMFGQCNSLKELDMSSFNTLNVNHMTALFENCYGLESLKLSDIFVVPRYKTDMFSNTSSKLQDGMKCLVDGITDEDIMMALKTDTGWDDNYLAFNIDGKVSGIRLDRDAVTLYEGGELTLHATITPGYAVNKNVTWSSSDTSVAIVDNNGKVKALKSGITSITVTTEDGSKTASCVVTVVEYHDTHVESVSLNKTSAELFVGETTILIATVNPSDATIKDVEWSSSNASIVSVDAMGKVKANSPGTAVITVITKDGGKTASCMVKVIYNGQSEEIGYEEWD